MKPITEPTIPLLYTIEVEHFHPDDGVRSDKRNHYVIANSNKEAHSLLRPMYGLAWRFTTINKQSPIAGVIL